MADNYSITINMTAATATGLSSGNYFLYGFKAVQGPGNGVPLVWFKSNNYSLSTVVSWTEAYQAFTTKAMVLTANTTITAAAPADIDLGQVLTVTSPTGVGTVSVPVSPRAGAPSVAIVNATNQPFTCGISQAQGDGSFQPLCAFPLYGNNTDEIVPLAKVLLMFATDAVDTGTVIEQSFSQGVLVDLTDSSQRTLTFDLNNGWTPQTWARVMPANTNLVGPLTTGND